jgi:hypothetical protein
MYTDIKRQAEMDTHYKVTDTQTYKQTNTYMVIHQETHTHMDRYMEKYGHLPSLTYKQNYRRAIIYLDFN